MSSSLVSWNALILGSVTVVVGIAWSSRVELNKKLKLAMSESLVNTLGYTGGFLQLGAVMAVSRGYLTAKSSTYHLMSLIGSSGLLLNAFYFGANPAVVINIIWMTMNLVGLREGISNADVWNTLLQGLLRESSPTPIPV